MDLIYKTSDLEVYIEQCTEKKKQSEVALRLLYDVLKEKVWLEAVAGGKGWDRDKIKETSPLKKGEHGKPYFEFVSEELSFEFNISHSGDYVAVAVGVVPVGVDIQIVQNNRMKLAGRFFSVEENEALDGLADEEKLQRFFQIWTRKEALLKADGCGITIDLRGFSTVPREVEFNGKKYTLMTLTEGVPRGYYISVGYVI